MASIHFVHPDGSRSQVEGRIGTSVMEIAVRQNVRGIDADCGGCCSCATCHVYVAPAFAERLAAPDSMELDMLEFVSSERRPTSRLSCQIEFSAALDGIVLEIPPTQGG